MRFMNVTRIFEWVVRVFHNRFVFSLTSITLYASNILNPLCRKRLSKGLFIFSTCFLHARETNATFVFHLFWFRYSRTFLKSEYTRERESTLLLSIVGTYPAEIFHIFSSYLISQNDYVITAEQGIDQIFLKFLKIKIYEFTIRQKLFAILIFVSCNRIRIFLLNTRALIC